MSDILIRGMEMPQNCRMCRYMVPENNTFVGLSIPAYCQCIDVNIKDDSVRHPDCPLIEVPKHGDLIEKPKSLYYGGLVKIAPNDFVGIAKYFMDQINSQQVIIPAERSEG